MIPTRGAHGGLRLEGHKERSTRTPIGILAAPAEAVLPLDQHSGIAAHPLVSVGARVLKGQPIAEPRGSISAWIHSPVSGQVIDLDERPSATRGGKPSLSIVIANDGREEAFASSEPLSNFLELSPADLLEHMSRAGIVGLGGAAFPTATKLSTAN